MTIDSFSYPASDHSTAATSQRVGLLPSGSGMAAPWSNKGSGPTGFSESEIGISHTGFS